MMERNHVFPSCLIHNQMTRMIMLFSELKTWTNDSKDSQTFRNA